MGRPLKINRQKPLSKKAMYLGNPDLPSVDATFTYTAEQSLEIETCMLDMLYFAENYFYIIADGEKEVIPLFPYQKRLIQAFKDNRFNIVLSSRQSGKCFSENTKLKIRNKKTNEIKEVSALEFYNCSEKRDGLL